ncbi:50S ribosomal protein L37ae [Candidatus Woesearchaeota archaeon ex4484_78]|nr:MAG: 50S ribosomal protein L37ae [Candidatus Woesearchaeota archaeon ex4484_78]
MAKKKKLGSHKRFGARYGRTVKEKLAKVESLYKKKNVCPYCHYPKVKRIAPGVWQCLKCGAKFTAGAYSPSKKNP